MRKVVDMRLTYKIHNISELTDVNQSTYILPQKIGVLVYNTYKYIIYKIHNILTIYN